MLNQIKKGAEYVLDIYRTAPLSETVVALETCLIYNSNDERTMVLGIIGGIAGIGMTAIQFELKHKLERITSKKGYDSKVFDKTIDHWCDGQTARIVAKKYGKLEEYVKSYTDKKYETQFPEIPHF